MGLLDKLFGVSTDQKEQKVLPWILLTEQSQLDDIVMKSNSKAQIIFKHSTRCGISRMVKNRFEEDFNLNQNEGDLYYLDLISFRDVSNEIAYKFQVMHESPQILVIKNGLAVVHASHGAINDIDLGKFI